MQQNLAQAVRLANAGQLHAALQLCERSLAEDGDQAGVRQLKASLQLRLGDAAAAVATLAPLLAAHPGHAPLLRLAVQAHFEQGRQLHGQAQAAQARQAFEVACELAPTLVPAWFALSLACEDLGDLDAAILALQRLLALAPDHTEALINLGLLEQARGRLDAALDCHARAWRAQPALLGRIAMALCSAPCGAVWASQAALEQALSQRPA